MKNKKAPAVKPRRIQPDVELDTIPAVVSNSPPQVEGQHEALTARAYYIWQQEGCPIGRSLEHWLLAEAQLNPLEKAPHSPITFMEPPAPPQRQGRRRLLDLIALI